MPFLKCFAVPDRVHVGMEERCLDLIFVELGTDHLVFWWRATVFSNAA